MHQAQFSQHMYNNYVITLVFLYLLVLDKYAAVDFNSARSLN